MNQKIYKTIFFGTPDFAVPVLEALTSLPFIDLELVVTQPDKPVGKHHTLNAPPVKVFAEQHDIPVSQPIGIRGEEFELEIKKDTPDVIIIVAYGKIIPKNLLAIPKHGWLNVHASLLPKYRGASPIQGALLAGETETGVTLMQLDADLDTGPIITQKQIAIGENETPDTLHSKLSNLGKTIIRDSLLPYLKGDIKPEPQPKNSPTPITTNIKKTDGRINWAQPAEVIERKVRAYTPWPSAFCYWDDKRLKIIKALVAQLPTELPHGKVWQHENSIIVGTGQEGLQLKTVQLQGKKAMPIDNFLKGHPEFVDAVLR